MQKIMQRFESHKNKWVTKSFNESGPPGLVNSPNYYPDCYDE